MFTLNIMELQCDNYSRFTLPSSSTDVSNFIHFSVNRYIQHSFLFISKSAFRHRKFRIYQVIVLQGSVLCSSRTQSCLSDTHHNLQTICILLWPPLFKALFLEPKQTNSDPNAFDLNIAKTQNEMDKTERNTNIKLS